jgi:N-formylmaleamate deformylase
MSSTTTWTEHDLTSGANTLHYARMGVRSGPPVVLLHGFSDAGLCWHRFASDIASEYDVILPDAAGHGRTSPPAPGEQQARGVADVLAVLDALGFNQVALVGHSMGAGTAARVAVAAPQRVRALALEDPGWRDGTWTPPEGGRGSHARLRSPEWIEWMRSLKTMTPEQRRAVADQERPEWPVEERPYWIEAKAQFNVDAFPEAPTPDMGDWRETARGLRCPTLLVTADVERGAIVSPEIATEASRINPNIRVVHIPDAGHNIRREQYAPFQSAVRGFLAEVHQPAATRR